MALTSAQTLRYWLYEALVELGGGTKRQVLDWIADNHGHLLTEEDQEQLTTRRETKWENNVAWVRGKLVDEGHLQDAGVRKNWWTLTPDGAAFAEAALRATGVGKATESNGADIPDLPTDPDLDEFKPKSHEEYRARTRAAVQVKTREHERLILDYGNWLSARKLKPSTKNHPIDMMIKGLEVPVIVEAKMLYNSNATNAVREASAQLLMYRHFLHAHAKCKMLGLFNEPIGSAYAKFLTSLNIDSVWRSEGSWSGTSRAVELKLAADVGT